MFKRQVVSLFLIIASFHAYAEIITDGTLGAQVNLQAPNYNISQDLGTTVGPNLFHSFEKFNIFPGEVATFSGQSTVKNVISRVTGGNVSTIDGILKNKIPNADTYFINPNGVMFGPNAQLDVQGSFYATTADTLKLQDGGEFNARSPENSRLTVASVNAFGFLTDNVAPIQINGSQLFIQPKKTLSLTGGELTMNNAKLGSPEGQIYLTSVNSSGEVTLTSDKPEISTASHNNVTLENGSVITTSGKGAGKIDIQAKTLTLKQSRIRADALKEGEKGKINIQVKNLNLKGSPNGRIHQDKVSFDTMISSATISDDDGGDINIEAIDSITLTNATIFANSGQLDIVHEAGETKAESILETGGRAGTITINTDYLKLDNSTIESNAFDAGQGGSIILTVPEKIYLDNGFIAVNAFESSSTQANRVGEIFLTTNAITSKNTILSSTTVGNGQGGNVKLIVNGPILLDHSAIVVDANTSNTSSVRPPPNPSSSKTRPKAPSGDAGSIYIEAETVTLTNRSNISSNASGSSQGGHITIYATEAMTLQNPEKQQVIENPKLSKTRFGIQAISLSQKKNSGHAGEVWLETPRLSLTEEADINTSSLGGGDAGHIHLIVDELNMQNETEIVSSNLGSGNAGDIVLNAQAFIHLQNSQLRTEAKLAQGGNIVVNVGDSIVLEGGQITTSVQGGSGDGGDITLQNPELVVLNCGQIKAQAYQGNGGNIRLTGDHFVTSFGSIISASSQLGVDGKVTINSPDETIHGDLLVLSSNFKDSSHLLRKPCKAIHRSQRSQFIVKRIAGSPLSPDDLRNSAFPFTLD